LSNQIEKSTTTRSTLDIGSRLRRRQTDKKEDGDREGGDTNFCVTKEGDDSYEVLEDGGEVDLGEPHTWRER